MRVALRVYPGAQRDEVGGRYGTTEPPILMVRVKAPAVDGKANAAVIEALAEAFGCQRTDVRVLVGHTGRHKIVEIDGGDTAALELFLS
jgi:uncharacterized protein (TIGR00251 family)